MNIEAVVGRMAGNEVVTYDRHSFQLFVATLVRLFQEQLQRWQDTWDAARKEWVALLYKFEASTFEFSRVDWKPWPGYIRCKS